MTEKMIKGFACEKCGKATLDKEDFIKCIKCEKYICKKCGYTITVKIDHNIPNGIPFLHTKTEYKICSDCMDLNKSPPPEVRKLLIPNKNGKLYRAGDEYEEKWVFLYEVES